MLYWLIQQEDFVTFEDIEDVEIKDHSAAPLRHNSDNSFVFQHLAVDPFQVLTKDHGQLLVCQSPQ